MNDPPRLFTYGTLQPSRLRWPFLEPFATGHRPARTPGRIYDSGRGWPAAVFSEADTALIPGTVVDLEPRREQEALRVLDEIEGAVDGLFVRVMVMTEAGERAWAYQWGWSLDGLIRIERWDRREEG